MNLKTQEQQIGFEKIPEHYDALERAMLDRYFEFLRTRSNSTFIHWNMRDVNFGFPAIEHRYRVLKGTPSIVSEDRKFDLSRALVSIYGIDYIGHPRLEKLLDFNSIGKRDFLSGKAEADAWDDKQFVRLHQSTLRKVDILANIFEMATDKSLKTHSKWYRQYGMTPAVAGEYLKEHWLTSVIGVLAIVSGGIVKGADLYKFLTSN